MSRYTTGEIAKLCGVSVRTVQYYDTRGILQPSELSEGGRRHYSEEDLKQLKIICFLRELDLPISSIGEILSEERPDAIITLLLDEQEKKLHIEIADKQSRLGKLELLRQSTKRIENFSVESIGDVVHIMENKKKLQRIRIIMLVMGIVMDIIQIGTIILWVKEGIWWPFVVGMCIALVIGISISCFYFKKMEYICPQCHAIFKPTFKQVFWARHTPNTRKLTCTECGHEGFCVEIYKKGRGKWKKS